MSGLFVSFEGGEACGKSTQVARLVRKLDTQGYQVLSIREPGSTRAGEVIRSLLLHPDQGIDLTPAAELLLFGASRAQLVEEVIRPAFNSGKVVVADRFSDSTTVYQGIARGLGLKFILKMEKFVCGDLRPSLTFLLDLDLETMRNRRLHRVRPVRGPDRMEELPLEFHVKVREGYLQLARQFPERIKVIDAAGSTEEVEAAIWKEINAVLGR
jgi:dTMP kinase